MSEKEHSTLQVILITGQNEFLENGYLGASLRNIERDEGVTTCAVYGDYSSSEGLFVALLL